MESSRVDEKQCSSKVLESAPIALTLYTTTSVFCNLVKIRLIRLKLKNEDNKQDYYHNLFSKEAEHSQNKRLPDDGDAAVEQADTKSVEAAEDTT